MAKKKKPEQRAQQRIGITLQLIIGPDDDLINAIGAIESSKRQGVLKTILRQSYGMPIPEPKQDVIDAIQNELIESQRQNEALNNQLNIMLDRINYLEENAQPTHVDAVGFDQLEELRNSLLEEIRRAINTPYLQPQPPPV
jgi:hypothetical protein